MAAQRATYIKGGLQAAMKALAAHDQNQIHRLKLKDLTKLFATLNESDEKLAQYQMRASSTQYEDSQSAYNRNVTISVAAIVVSILLASISGFLLLRAVCDSLNQALAHFRAIANGI